MTKSPQNHHHHRPRCYCLNSTTITIVGCSPSTLTLFSYPHCFSISPFMTPILPTPTKTTLLIRRNIAVSRTLGVVILLIFLSTFHIKTCPPPSSGTPPRKLDNVVEIAFHHIICSTAKCSCNQTPQDAGNFLLVLGT